MGTIYSVLNSEMVILSLKGDDYGKALLQMLSDKTII